MRETIGLDNVIVMIPFCRSVEEVRKVGLCGQAPSDHPEFAAFVVQEGIDSISLNPDSVVDVITQVAEAEKKQ